MRLPASRHGSAYETHALRGGGADISLSLSRGASSCLKTKHLESNTNSCFLVWLQPIGRVYSAEIRVDDGRRFPTEAWLRALFRETCLQTPVIASCWYFAGPPRRQRQTVQISVTTPWDILRVESCNTLAMPPCILRTCFTRSDFEKH